jgi:exopolysaccharide production protein ExoQ
MTQIATGLFVLGILGLFMLNRDANARTSKALWLPVLWLLIAGSRPFSAWLQLKPVKLPDQYLEGSPLDRLFFIVILAAGLVVLFWRRAAVGRFLWANGPMVLFILYCAISISWSDYPDVAFKRWIKSIGDYVMILIVLTETDRLAAVRRVLARVGFLLIPLSVLFIKYYPYLGRAYAAHWEAAVYFTGVATDKNMLGMTCLVFGLGSVWCLLQELRSSKSARRFGPLIAHGAIVVMVIWLLRMANSMTSLSCFLMGSTLMVAASTRQFVRRPRLVHILILIMLAVSVSALFFQVGSGLVEGLGRDSTLTGRTALWGVLLKMTANPIWGTGFESFWLGDRLRKLWDIYWWQPNEAHNGYLEVYLNLGWIGIVLVAVILVTTYRKVIRLLRQDPGYGRLSLAYFFTGVTYNLTEAAMRETDLVWIIIVLTVFAASEAAVWKNLPEKGPAEKAPLGKTLARETRHESVV